MDLDGWRQQPTQWRKINQSLFRHQSLRHSFASGLTYGVCERLSPKADNWQEASAVRMDLTMGKVSEKLPLNYQFKERKLFYFLLANFTIKRERSDKKAEERNQPWANWWRKLEEIGREWCGHDITFRRRWRARALHRWHQMKMLPVRRKTTITFCYLYGIQLQMLPHIHIYENFAFHLTCLAPAPSPPSLSLFFEFIFS